MLRKVKFPPTCAFYDFEKEKLMGFAHALKGALMLDLCGHFSFSTCKLFTCKTALVISSACMWPVPPRDLLIASFPQHMLHVFIKTLPHMH